MPRSVPHFGLALGGGGARGLAHIKILQVIDEFGIKPKIIAGTSMGALVGCLYASGMSGLEIEDYAKDLFSKRTELLKRMYGNRPNKWVSLINLRTPSILNAETFFQMLMPEDLPENFEDLKIPFHAITTDFYTQELYTVSKGKLIPAVAASSALPALLKPVELDERVLIDGGFVNPVPFNILNGKVDVTIAVDVTGEQARLAGKVPNSIDALIGCSQILLRSLTNTMLNNNELKNNQPLILSQPKVGRYNVLDYFKIEDILAHSEAAADQLRHDLEQTLNQQVA
ncbi:MAG: patatin-like phospholipase family protein [Rhizobiales bacterium]|nr:patatin-like phospholipase family protein [Hyphomicrobiales bacterium]